MDLNESLILNFWKNAEEQLLEIEKEILLPQIEDRRRFLEDYKQALIEFLDAFDSYRVSKESYDFYLNVTTNESESLASMLFRKYSFCNKKYENYDVDLAEERDVVKSYIYNLEALSAVLPRINEFLNLFLNEDSNQKFINECSTHFSLWSFSQIDFILSLSLSQLKNANLQAIKDDIVKYSAISEFLNRITFGVWEREVVEEDDAEVTYYFDAKKKKWEKHCKRIESEDDEITYLFNTETNEWEKDFKMEYGPSGNCYNWDKQNEKWKLIEDDDTV